MRYFIDVATGARTTETLNGVNPLVLAALIFFIAALIEQALTVSATYLSENVGWTSTNLLRRDLAQHCLHLDMSFHNEHTPGEFIERIDGDISALANFFSQFIIQVLGNSLLLFGVLVLLFREDWRVGLSMTLFALIMFLALIRMRHIGVPYWRDTRQASADFFGFLGERLAGTEDLRASGANAYTIRRFHELVRVFWQSQVKAGLMSSLMVNVSWVLIALGNATAFIISGYLFQAGTLTIGAVYLIFYYSNLLVRPIERIAMQLEDLQRAGAGLGRIQELFQVQPRITGGLDALPAESFSVRFQNVSFAYTEDEPVLNDISFDLAKNSVLGLLGRTGSGKTTLTRLILHLYEAQAGQVLLNDQPISTLDTASLYQNVAMVTQQVQLFHATIRHNLTFFDPGISDDRILEALETLGLGAWLQAQPEGLDTYLDSGGSGLSAGEAQLLAFVRVFLKDLGLVILDEASSRLDPATEQLIEQALDQLLAERTAIIIAHRLHTVQRADEILILEDGCIREHGPRAVLAADPYSQFYHLLQTGLETVLA